MAAAAVLVAVLLFGLTAALETVRARYVFGAVPVRQPVIALTFDDGPHPDHTVAMLDALESRGLSATFFVVGEEAEKHFDILERIVQDGHEVGNHTHTHPYVEELAAASLVHELALCDEVIARATGEPSAWYRAPRGQLSFVHEWSVVRSGKRIAGWTRCLESSQFRDPLLLAAALEPGDIVLVHDGRLDRTMSQEMLPAFLDAAQARGFEFVTLSELDAMRTPHITTSVLTGRF